MGAMLVRSAADRPGRPREPAAGGVSQGHASGSQQVCGLTPTNLGGQGSLTL